MAHPVGEAGEGYESIRDQVGLWVGIHMLQPFLALGLAVGLWQLVRNSSLPSARVARIALPIWLVAFTAFDSVAGIASGLVVHHANGSPAPTSRPSATPSTTWPSTPSPVTSL